MRVRTASAGWLTTVAITPATAPDSKDTPSCVACQCLFLIFLELFYLLFYYYIYTHIQMHIHTYT
jgi:hypothetical protein